MTDATEHMHSSIRQWLHSRSLAGSKFGTQRVEYMLKRLGNPEKMYPIVHVTGTNGKGSTTAYIFEMLQAHGLKVGVFSSPYLVTFEEQISIQGEAIPIKELDGIMARLKPIVTEMDSDTDDDLVGMTEFELLVVAMYLYFAEQQFDIAIVEVGLGGTLDATNVIIPIVSVITTVALEHTDFLGTTLETIAHHKAGIIKSKVPVVVGKMADEALKVIQSIATEQESEVAVYGRELLVEEAVLSPVETRFTAVTSHKKLANVILMMKGYHQAHNAVLALQTVEWVARRLELSLSDSIIKDALKRVEFLGRLEIMHTNPLVYLDGAHNPAGIETLSAFIEQGIMSHHPKAKVMVIFSAIQGKDSHSMLKQLLELSVVEQIHVTTFADQRAMTIAQIGELIKGFSAEEQQHLMIQSDWQKTLVALLENSAPSDSIIVTGSLYFLSQVRRFLVECRSKSSDK